MSSKAVRYENFVENICANWISHNQRMNEESLMSSLHRNRQFIFKLCNRHFVNIIVLKLESAIRFWYPIKVLSIKNWWLFNTITENKILSMSIFERCNSTINSILTKCRRLQSFQMNRPFKFKLIYPNQNKCCCPTEKSN